LTALGLVKKAQRTQLSDNPLCYVRRDVHSDVRPWPNALAIGDCVHEGRLISPRRRHNLWMQLALSSERRVMFPTKILVAVDGFEETSWVVRAAVESARGTGSELHIVHVVPKVPELVYLHLAAKEGVESFADWRRLKGLEVLDRRVRQIGEDLGGVVAASHYREGKPDKEIVSLGEEIDAGLIMIGGRRQTPFERLLGPNLAEKVLRRAGRPVLIIEGRSSRGLAVQR
jgi:nucleotide-binding universal stress UspA family protein